MKELMAELWMEELELDSTPGPEDSFFDLGGDSLKAKYICQDLFEETGIVVSIADFYRNDLFGDIVAIVEHMRESDT